MKILVLLSFAGCLIVSASEHQATKRSLPQFNRMLYYATGYGVYRLAGYGCWCDNPTQEQSVEPKDYIDRCCKNRINCLKDAVDNSGCQNDTVYNYDIPESKPAVCLEKYILGTPDKQVTGKVVDSCASKICNCDLTAVKCFKEATFDREYRYFDRNQC